MQASLPPELIEVFERSVTTDYVTLDARGQPVAWPVTPYYHGDEGCIDVATPVERPRKADEAARDPHVALLFSERAGAAEGAGRSPIVLVQGTAAVDRDVRANRERFRRDSSKARRSRALAVPGTVRSLLSRYVSPIYVHVRPERIYVWPGLNGAAEPSLYDAHLEEVRSGHSEEPELDLAPPEGGPAVWDGRLDELGPAPVNAALCVVAPDGFPFAVRVPVRIDRRAGLVRLTDEPVGAPLKPGPACLSIRIAGSPLRGQRTLGLQGDLVRDGRGWGVAPHRVAGAPARGQQRRRAAL